VRAVVQRVTHAQVSVDGEVIAAVGPGLCVLLGVGPGDDEATARRLADRVATLRIHADEAGRMNRDLLATGGAALVISQFTLYADSSRGHRPSFIGAGPPQLAERLCDAFCEALRDKGIEVATGRFAAHMRVALENDGPVTIVLSSGEDPWAADAG
jgi:D-tyrosyl-tRNA(Tyr) deacylase